MCYSCVYVLRGTFETKQRYHFSPIIIKIKCYRIAAMKPYVLECGHSEYKPRASRADKLACMWCVKAVEKEEEMKSFTAPPPSIFVEYEEDNSASSEIHLGRVRASLSSVMKVPLEAIEIVASQNRGVLEIKAAYIFLSAGDINRIIQKGEM